MRKGKEPDTHSYLWLTDPDTDPGGPNTYIGNFGLEILGKMLEWERTCLGKCSSAGWADQPATSHHNVRPAVQLMPDRNGTPTKRQVSKRQVSKRLVSKRPVLKRQVYKTSGLQNARFQNVWFQNVWFQNVQFLNLIYLLNNKYRNCQVCIPI